MKINTPIIRRSSNFFKNDIATIIRLICLSVIILALVENSDAKQTDNRLRIIYAGGLIGKIEPCG